MAIVNSAARVGAGFGVPTIVYQVIGTALSGASAQIWGAGGAAKTITGGPTTMGRVRVKVLNGGSSDVAVTIVVAFSDGTGTVQTATSGSLAVPNVASSGADFITDYVLDISATTLSITTTLTGTTKTATMDVELIGQP